MIDVVLELGDQSLNAIEFSLTAKKMSEPHTCRLAIQVVIEVEQMSLEQRVVGVFVEGRPPAEIDRARVNIATRSLVPGAEIVAPGAPSSILN